MSSELTFDETESEAAGVPAATQSHPSAIGMEIAGGRCGHACWCWFAPK
jgi:hypothetical protein